MAKLDPEILAHLEWLGFIRPTGLVVSAPALVRAGAILDRRDAEGQQFLRDCAEERAFPGEKEPAPWLPDFRAFAESVLGWSFSPKGYAGTVECPIPPELELPLPDYGETLCPDFAVRELEPQNGASPWQLLVRILEPGEAFERVVRGHGQLEASAHGRMERLLRQTGVPAGLLFNGRALRLLSAPRGESSGWLDFRVADMVQTAGRPMCTALRLLLGQSRLLGLPRVQRLAALLEDSRKFQNEVSERLAEQVLHALYEVLRGFQAAHDVSKGNLLRQSLAEHPDEVYRALLTVILRLVFLLYAEERDMLPEDETFLRSYSLAGLYERLREDAALFPDTMDQRFGAWAQLLVLFRMIHDGAESGAMRLPKRHGALFDPDRFPFLEGRPSAGTRQIHERIEAPLVPDGTVYRALEKLLVLDGERISYRALDVEEIGSVYQAMMGFRLRTATGRSLAIRAQKKWAAATTVDLDALLAEPADKRKKWLEERTGRHFSDTVQKAVKEARTIDDLHAGLNPVTDRGATPDLVPSGAMVLQPSEERRRSGSHYTPRALTEPIVRTTLEPILARLRSPEGRPPQPEQILDLKICDPAMGSGAFLVEACRQLGDALVEAWNARGQRPAIPADEDEVVFARRLVVQRCLYGVDRNPVAVDLAKVSLWLVTLAKDHALTFVDHALRYGDSLVGLSRRQIEAFHWEAGAPSFQAGLETMRVREHVANVAGLRQRIREAGESVPDWELRDLWDEAQLELGKVRLFGDLVVAAFFQSEKPKEREAKRREYAGAVVGGQMDAHRGRLDEWRHGDPPLAPFHWEIEFPEVFERDKPGFDAIVGNPPFANKNTVGAANPGGYIDWLKYVHVESHGNADLVAHFFRRAFSVVRDAGSFGLVATNTIRQGDTRRTSLRWICEHGGRIFAARRRVRWPGLAAVVVSVVHVMKGNVLVRVTLDGEEVETITAFLFHKGGHKDPATLVSNRDVAREGVKWRGDGFILTTEEGRNLIERDAANKRVVKPLLIGDVLKNSPRVEPDRFIIDFSGLSAPEASAFAAPFSIILERVRPYRESLPDTKDNAKLRAEWWLFERTRSEFLARVKSLPACLALGVTGTWHAVVKISTEWVPANTVVVFISDGARFFAVVQSRLHEIWAQLFGSSMKDDPRYTPSDCFETFPFPENWESHPALEVAGKVYYEFRATLMVKNDEGLTETYNRLHDPEESDPQIAKLRELHAAMDRAVLDAYGWSDIRTDCKFFLDYEIDEEVWGDRKKPWRYRWPDGVRDEVLARLLELNAERAKEEARSGAPAEKRGRKAAAKRALSEPDMGDLLS